MVDQAGGGSRTSGANPTHLAAAALLVFAATFGLARAGDGSDRVVTAGAAPRDTAAGTVPSTTAATTPSSTTEPALEPSTATSTPVTAEVPATTVPPVEVATTLAPVPPSIDASAPPVVARSIPEATAPPLVLTSPWAGVTRSTGAGYTSVEVGCAAGTDAAALDAFFAERIGPVLGLDYQHVYPLGGERFLWIFQDTFLDYSGLAARLDQAAFVHNTALVQDGRCFTLLHRGSVERPASFEGGAGERRLTRWFWPMGGELTAQGLQVFWVEMVKDGYEPGPGDGLGWHPETTYLATYDPVTLARTGFGPAPNPGVAPVYGYAVSSDASYTYLFGNTFEQNLVREGGFGNGPHSATAMWLARVPLGQLGASPEYRTADGWSPDPAQAVAVSRRFWVENPMQPRYLDGVWWSAAKVDGYWGDELIVDVANDPWGPWTTVSRQWLSPRGGDALMNTYHAHLVPWRDAAGNVVVVISQNARDMTRDAFPVPARYRPQARTIGWTTPPPPPPPPPDTTVAETTSSVPETTVAEATTTTTVPPTVVTTAPPDPSTTTTAVPTTTATTAPPVTATAAAPVSSTAPPTTPPTTAAAPGSSDPP